MICELRNGEFCSEDTTVLWNVLVSDACVVRDLLLGHVLNVDALS